MSERIKHKTKVLARTRVEKKREVDAGGPTGGVNEVRPSTTTPGEIADSHVSAAQRKVLGQLDDDGHGKNAGAKAAQVGLEALAPKKKKKSLLGGVAAMMIGLSLLSSVPNMAKAQDLLANQGGTPIAVQLENRAYRQTLPELGDTTVKPGGTIAPEAVERFYQQMERALRLDARGIVLDMSEGRAPYFLANGTRGLSSEQQKEVLRAAKDLVMEIPLRALSPDLIGVARDALTMRGLSTAGLEDRKLGDLGDIGKDLANDIVKDLRGAHPTAFNTLGAVAAVAIGAVAGMEGTDALRAIGIRPEARLRFLDGALQTRVRAEWDQRFTNPKLSAGLYGNFPVGTFQGQAGISLDASGPSFSKLDLTGVTLSGTVAGVLQNGGLLGVSGQAQVGSDGKVTSAGVGMSYAIEQWTVGAGATWLDGNRFQSSLSIGYRPSRNVDVFLLGTHDSGGQAFVGIGARIGF